MTLRTAAVLLALSSAGTATASAQQAAVPAPASDAPSLVRLAPPAAWAQEAAPLPAWGQGAEPRLGRYTGIGLGVGVAAGALFGLGRCHDSCAGTVLVTSALFGFVGFGVGCALDSSLHPGTPYLGCSFLASGR